MPGTTVQPTIKRLKLDTLVIDKRYQRPLHHASVAKITGDFDPVLCGVLEVSSGVNGAYAVFDGQHRLAALQLLGEKDWPCRVHNLTPKQQAEKFVRTQTERRNVHPVDRHKAALFSGDELAVKVDVLVREAGFSIGNGHVFGELSCPGAIYTAYEIYGAAALKRALGVIDEAWGREDHLARKSPMVKGMTLLFAKYADEIDTATLIEKLRSVPAARITRAAHSEQALTSKGTTAWVMVARQLLEIYNAQPPRRSKKCPQLWTLSRPRSLKRVGATSQEIYAAYQAGLH